MQASIDYELSGIYPSDHVQFSWYHNYYTICFVNSLIICERMFYFKPGDFKFRRHLNTW